MIMTMRLDREMIMTMRLDKMMSMTMRVLEKSYTRGFQYL